MFKNQQAKITIFKIKHKNNVKINVLSLMLIQCFQVRHYITPYFINN